MAGTNDIVRVPFHGDEILTVDVDGRPHVVLKPALESIGVDYWTQVEKLRTRSWAGTRQSPVPTPGGVQDMVVCDVRTFLMLLATIDERRVGKDVKPKLIAYQNEVADAIEAYWTRGGAINPRATDEQLTAIISRAEAQARVLRALDGIVDARWLEAKARHVAARALGEEPEVTPADRPLTVGEFLEEHGVTGAELRSMSPSFGRRLKALYVAEHGEEPGKVDRFVDGALRPVAAYTERDRPLFEQVWDRINWGAA